MVGKLAVSLAGHDKGSIFLVIREDGDVIWLAVGISRLYQSPKRKKRKHVQLVLNGGMDRNLKTISAKTSFRACCVTAEICTLIISAATGKTSEPSALSGKQTWRSSIRSTAALTYLRMTGKSTVETVGKPVTELWIPALWKTPW